MKFTQKYSIALILFLMAAFFMPDSIYSKSFLNSSHGDRSKLPRGCASCHKGHGVRNTPMLSGNRETFCFRCHGDIIDREKTKKSGYLASHVQGLNIQKEFEKAYRHPVDKTGIHQHDEVLPETDPSKPRHAECVDCHHHHYVTRENKMSGISGVTQDGVTIPLMKDEYEVCFRCHSYSANLPGNQTNKAELFKTSNPSFHPLITQGRNHSVPSLIPPLTEFSTIKCTDCHNNDDPLGPRGPHGSNYQYILTKNFITSDGPENAFQYDLCYHCHRRSNVLGNQSFRYHNLHISSVGTSCRTCHNPHGSTQYTHLIDFDNLNIMPSNSGRLAFRDLGEKAGECFLNCHNKDHDPASYPVKTSPTTSQGSSKRR